MALGLLQRGGGRCGLQTFHGIRLATHTPAAGLPQTLRDADNTAILAYLRLSATAAAEEAGGGGGGAGGTGEDTYRVNRHLRPREEWAATTTVEYTITVTNPDRAERCAFTLVGSGLRLGVGLGLGLGLGLTLTLALTRTLTLALTLTPTRYAPDIKTPDARLRRRADRGFFAMRSLALATPLAAAPPHDAQRAAFNKYDTNQSGELDHKELRSALETVGLTITSAHAATLLAKYDTDQSGLMEFDEFQQLCTALEAVSLDLAGDGKPSLERLETTPMKVPSVTVTGTAGEGTLPQIRTRGLVTVPVGVKAGEHFIAQTADGQRLRVVAPPGSSAGMTIPIDPVSGDVVVDNVHEGFRGGGGGGGGNRFGAGVTGGAAAAVAAVRGAAAAEPMRWWAVGGKEAAVSGVTRAEVAIRTSASNTGGAYGGGAPGGGGGVSRGGAAGAPVMALVALGRLTRFAAEAEAEIGVLPQMAWHDLAALGAQSSCEQALRSSSAVRAAVPRIDAILDDCRWKVRELLALPLAAAAALPTPPASLGVDRLLALVAYTHELQRVGGVRAGNLHHELNQARRTHAATA